MRSRLTLNVILCLLGVIMFGFRVWWYGLKNMVNFLGLVMRRRWVIVMSKLILVCRVGGLVVIDRLNGLSRRFIICLEPINMK